MSGIAFRRPARLLPAEAGDNSVVIPLPPRIDGVPYPGRLRKRGSASESRRYLEVLAEARQSARELARAHAAATSWQWPGPDRLWAIANERRRVWERRPGDRDFLILRAGLGPGPMVNAPRLATCDDSGARYDAKLLQAAQRVASSFATLGGEPATVDLVRAGVVSIVGAPQQARALGRALLTQLAVLHAPDDVTLAVSAGGSEAQWAWAAWLPHTRGYRSPDSAHVPVALVAKDFGDLTEVVERELSRADEASLARSAGRLRAEGAAKARRFVIAIDGLGPRPPWESNALGRRLVDGAGPAAGIAVITLATDQGEEPSRVGARLIVDRDGRLTLEARHPALLGAVTDAEADLPSSALCEATARALAPLILDSEAREGPAAEGPLGGELDTSKDFAGSDPEHRWLGAAHHDRLDSASSRIAAGEHGPASRELV